MNAEISNPKKSSKNQKEDNTSKESPASKQNGGYSSEDQSKLPAFNFSDNFNNQYDALMQTEQRLAEINEEILKLKTLLKSVSRIDRQRGIVSTLTPTQRKLNQAKLKKLKEQKFIENQNWQDQYKAFGGKTADEIEKAKDSLYTAQGRSGYYVKRYSGTIINRIKILLDEVLADNAAELDKLKENLNTSVAEEVEELIYDFLKNYEKNPFLSTFYRTHKDLQKSYTSLISVLLNEWDGKSDKEFSFKQSSLTINETN